MSAIKRFKSYAVRIPKIVKETLSEELRPEQEYVAVDVTGSKTQVEINNSFEAAAGLAVEKIGALVGATRDALVAAGQDASFLAGIPNLELVKKHLVEALKLEDALREAFRAAAVEEYLAKNPAVAKVIADAKKQPTSSRGLKVDVEF
jgi:hypothetical protein